MTIEAAETGPKLENDAALRRAALEWDIRYAIGRWGLRKKTRLELADAEASLARAILRQIERAGWRLQRNPSLKPHSTP